MIVNLPQKLGDCSTTSRVCQQGSANSRDHSGSDAETLSTLRREDSPLGVGGMRADRPSLQKGFEIGDEGVRPHLGPGLGLSACVIIAMVAACKILSACCDLAVTNLGHSVTENKKLVRFSFKKIIRSRPGRPCQRSTCEPCRPAGRSKPNWTNRRHGLVEFKISENVYEACRTLPQ